MSGVDAAATLSLKIDTTSANESLTALENRMKGLGASLNSGSATQPKAISTIGTSAAEASAQLKTILAPLATIEARLSKAAESNLMSGYAQSFGGFSTSLKLAAADTKEKIGAIEGEIRRLAETTRGLAGQQITWGFKIDRSFAGTVTDEARKAFEASVQYDRAWEEAHSTHRAKILADEIKQGEQIVAAYAQRNALIQQLDVERYEAAGREALRLKSIQESRDKQLFDEEVAKYARRNELIQQLDVERYEAAGREALRLKSIQESRDKQLFDEEVAKYARRNELIQQLDVERYEAAGREALRLKSIQESRDKQLFDEEVAKYARRNELIQQLDVERYEAAGREALRLKSIQESRDKQLFDEEVAKYARRNELIQQLDVERYEAAGREALRLKSIQESRDQETYRASVAAFERQLAMERKYILASEEMRLKAAIDARKLMDAGYKGNLITEFAPQTLAMAGASTLAALEAQMKALGIATKQAAGHQSHWNTLANEGNAAARGLAGSLGGLWLTYGSLIPLAAAAALASSLKNVFTTGKALEYQFTYIQAITGGVVVSLHEFSEAVKGSLFTPTESAGALRTLAQAGLSVSESMTTLPSILKLATVGEVDLGHAALSATAIMHTFGKSVEDIPHIGDVFATAARLSATSVKEMMEAMKQASSVANVFGVSVEETAAALATLANRGIEGSAAGTAIRNMVKELASPATDKAAYALQQYGIQIFNADGSAKKFTDNLQQLADVTSVMTKQTKARFLEDMFNERGAKAANILLSDLEKMKDTLREIEMSSKGLGFMSEATIKIAQSTDGLLKEMKSGIQLTLGEVFREIEPQVKNIISSISDLVKSSEFKAILTSIAEAVANFTVALKDHAATVGYVIAAYAGFKILGTIGAAILSTVGPVSSLAAALSSTVPIATTLGALFSGPVAVGLGAVALVAATLALKQKELDDAQKKTVDSAIALTDAQTRLNSSLESGLSALTKSNQLQAERIRLLREGKSAADAAASSMDNLGYANAKAAVTKIQSDLSAAKAHLESPQFAKEDINFNPSPAYDQAFNAYHALLREAKKANAQLEESASNTIRAGMQGRQKEIQDVQEKAFAEVEVQNKKFEAIARRKNLAETELSEGKFYGTKEQIDARKKTLQADIARGEAASKFQPLDTRTAESKTTQVEIARRDAFLSANSLGYERKPKAEKVVGGGGSKVRDYSGDLEKSNIASLVERQQEDIKVLELTHKNHLITEEQYQAQLVGVYATWGPRIEEEYSSSIARLAKLQAASSGDQAAQYEKKRKDMETAYRKFQFDEAYRSADSLAAEMGRIKKSGEEIQKVLEEQQANTDQIMERLAATRIKLDLTPEQAAGYDARKAVEKPLDKSIAGKRAEEQNLLNAGYSEESASLKAVRAEIELLIEARSRLGQQAAAQAEAEVGFARSYEYGWKSAFRAWTDEGTNAAKTAADSFAVMTNGMESLIDNFLTTGKLGFADFAKSVILSIAKIEARAALSQGLKAVGGNGGGGFGGIISGILGAITGGGGGGFSSGDFANLASSFIDSAKGNVFSGSPSLHAYANTVQTSPKTFAFQNLHGFARGGVFAEAGPEAVMPLSRDSRGRLGVKASSEGGPINITVHVNGNSNAPDVRRAAGQGAREALAAFNGARRYA